MVTRTRARALRFLHVPRTGGRSIEYGWRLRQPECLSHTLPTAKPSAWSYGFTRNPWDRVVSLWGLFHVEHGMGLGEWLRAGQPHRHGRGTNGRDIDLCAPAWTWLRHADWVGRFERRAADLAALSRILGRPAPTTHVNVTELRRGRSYCDFYDAEARAIVAERYAVDIELGGYLFSQPF